MVGGKRVIELNENERNKKRNPGEIRYRHMSNDGQIYEFWWPSGDECDDALKMELVKEDRNKKGVQNA